MIWIWEALQVRFEAQPWLNHVRQGWPLVPQVTKNPPLIYVGYQAKGGSIYQSTAYLSAETLYICVMDLWSTPSEVWGSTMMYPHQTGGAYPLKTENWPSSQGSNQANGGAILYPFTAYQCSETLNICILCICEALQVGFEAHLWCNHIR